MNGKRLYLTCFIVSICLAVFLRIVSNTLGAKGEMTSTLVVIFLIAEILSRASIIIFAVLWRRKRD